MKKIFYLFLLLCSPFTIEASTITVTSGADAGAGTLRAAITSAVAGDDIVFSGVTTVTLTSAELLINKNLTINGGTGVTVTRDAGATNFRIFNISGVATTVVFNKLSITNGKATGQAGGIQCTANVTLNDCIIANNEAPQAGGIQNDNILVMNRCFVHNNRETTGTGSGLVIYGIITTLNNCVFTNNQGAPAIGLQSSGSSLTVTNCTIAKNAGIGIHIANGSATLKNTIVAENTGTPPNIKNNLSLSSAYNLIGTEGGNGGLTNGANNNFVGISPLFVNSSDPDGADNIFGTADDGLMPSACSPALNAGDNTHAPTGTDIVGNMRTFGTNVDMGAYEFQASASSQPTITLGTIPAILAGATTFTIPYTATTGSPTTYSISGTGLTTATNVALPSSPITVNLSAAASTNLTFTLTVKNAGGCTSSAKTGSVSVNTPITVSCSTGIATATFNGVAPVAPTATTAGVGGKGGLHIYTVPAGVTAVRIDARGAKGGSSPITGGGTFVGGNGGRVQATYAVTPGDVLYILVGGKGGDGSLDNGVNERTASGGGGATVVSKGLIGTGTLLLVAGGGGGAGHSGAGGQSNSTPGSGAGGVGAGGASFSAAGGNSTVGDNCGAGGQALNAGGNGGANTCFKSETNGGGYGGGGAGNYSIANGNAGGGGGGGYVGGNAGGVAGGNGGSSFTDPTASNVTTNNHTDDNGSVTITILNSDQNLTWTGAVSTDWSNRCNWSPNLLPTATNLVTIPNVTNKPVISSGTSVAKSVLIDGLGASLTVNNGATLTASKIDITQGQIINNACGTIKVTGDYANNGTATTTNQGFILINGVLNNAGTFTNTGVLKYTTLTGTITNNQASSVIVRNLTYPIFAYGGTFNGTINGIFTDTLATVSAGTFTAPFAFTPLATLPRGVQTLYVKITPSGGACSYIVPFSYNTLTSSVSKIDAQAVVLQQNRPNPFSQETTISFVLPETNKVTLTVYDITGRQVYSVNKNFNSGNNEVVLNKSIFQNSGTYIYRLTSDKFSAVKRMQFIAE